MMTETVTNDTCVDTHEQYHGPIRYLYNSFRSGTHCELQSIDWCDVGIPSFFANRREANPVRTKKANRDDRVTSR